MAFMPQTGCMPCSELQSINTSICFKKSPSARWKLARGGALSSRFVQDSEDIYV